MTPKLDPLVIRSGWRRCPPSPTVLSSLLPGLSPTPVVFTFSYILHIMIYDDDFLSSRIECDILFIVLTYDL